MAERGSFGVVSYVVFEAHKSFDEFNKVGRGYCVYVSAREGVSVWCGDFTELFLNPFL